MALSLGLKIARTIGLSVVPYGTGLARNIRKAKPYLFNGGEDG